MSHIVVPSQHVKETIERTGNITTPLSVVSESFFDEIAKEEALPSLDLGLTTDFNLLVLGQMTGNSPVSDRKNLFLTVKWLCEAFSNDSNVGIILKTNSGRNTTIDRHNTTIAVREMIQKYRKGSFPSFYLLHGNMDQSEISALYKNEKVKGLVSLTRGEGFGLPLLEAAASDLPVIATNWSGHLDFLKLGRFIPINYTLQRVDNSKIDGNIFVTGSQWAEPIESDFKKKVVKFRKSHEIPTEWARDLGENVRREFSQEAIQKQYDKEIGKYLV
jgi:glycosyltransferase involved in cell wall biosynthesis